MSIKLFNTLNKKKEEFTPLNKDEVKIYTCGPTVYNYAHIGNLRAYVFADILRRMFKFNNYKVTQVINITDVGHLTSDGDEGEDKLVKGAMRENKTVWEIAKHYEDAFFNDLKLMNIEFPEQTPRATNHISEMIDLIKKIEDNGYTYESEGNIYFDTKKFENYGALIGRQSDDDSKSRVDVDKHKKNKSDFVLWFTRHKYGNHEMEWDSPWGRGFPGWHVECSAMSCKYLGEQFDIHTGGVDHIPIHHTNEIAQSEAAFGHKWVNYWLHNEFLVMQEQEKMSKSKDGFLTLQVLLNKGYKPEEYRYFLLGTHYRKKIMFSYEAMDSAKNSLNRLIVKTRDLKKSMNNKILDEIIFNKQLENFKENINDDLNTSKALATLWETFDLDVNDFTKLELLKKYDEVLGLKIFEQDEVIPQEIIELQKQRDEARKNKDWEKSDELRDLILSKGFKVLDSKNGTEIIKK